ncbi:GMC oxidoreductase [Ectothiorhodospira shaposhnikovii]|uniref:GMC oxidoreductase n=1 Tax=Ectothiorhodospira shaposhnikovii TaxID=1054 RepID=UPI001EE8D105|nr:GMC family oxidoreductase [Ectothiorhodospira shaposhnikovii]MCG5512183.1 GMC family oxidoreductase [Ectothiorhodospira shaposhnikovii]
MGQGLDGEAVDDLINAQWDAIVVGTGMGGATIGHALARMGWRILFCEKGASKKRESLRGQYAESWLGRPAVPAPRHAKTLRAAGRFYHEIEDVSDADARRFIPFIGAGAGGSSALYGMALERFFPEDFLPGRYHPLDRVPARSSQWPFSYESFEPYYVRAEKLYRVQFGPGGGEDAGSLPNMSTQSRALYEHFSSQGLTPYRLPQGCRFVDGCVGCQGFLCAKDCKHEPDNICLEPALNQEGAALLENFEVQSIEMEEGRATGVVGRLGDRRITIRGGVVILAGGALATPALLLNSRSVVWPNGVGNHFDQVGRYLMRHLIDLYAVFPRVGPAEGNAKELAFNDFYCVDQQKLGTVQSFGSMPPGFVLADQMLHDLQLGTKKTMPVILIRVMRPLMEKIFGRLFARAHVLASIMEDTPHSENRVMIHDDDPEVIRIKYHVSTYDEERLALFRSKIKSVLRPLRYLHIQQAHNNERIAHVCGTCRAGTDPAKSVVDEWSRVHGTCNLYVVDASWFPSSGGTNPALTIAANALRVADHLGEKGKVT